MKLKEKIFVITDNNGKSIDLSKEKQISFLINGENKGAEIKDLFVKYELDENEIIGFSLLQYFKIKEGALVDDEGNTVIPLLADKNIPLQFKEIDMKWVPLDDIYIQLNYIEAFSYSLIGIKNPELLFSDLSDLEKKTIVDAREEKNKTTQQADAKLKEEADRLKEEADKLKEEADAKKKLKDSINPKFVYEKKDYRNIQELFSDEGGKEYIQGPYHLFYVAPTEEEPNPKDATVLIKRSEDWWQEDEDGEITTENDKTVQYEFSDGEQKKIIVLDVENGTIIVDNPRKSEVPQEPSKG